MPRHSFKLTAEQEKQLNNYIIEVINTQGKIPHGIKTKLFRWAFKEWMEKHGEDYDIDWESDELPGSKK